MKAMKVPKLPKMTMSKDMPKTAMPGKKRKKKGGPSDMPMLMAKMPR